MFHPHSRLQVHHHVEKLPCESPQSHDVTMSSKLDAASENKRNGVTVLKLGSTKEDPLSVLVTPAFKGPIQNEVYSGKQLTNSLQSGQIYKAAWGSHGPQSYPWNYGSDAAKQFINHVRRRNSVMEPVLLAFCLTRAMGLSPSYKWCPVLQAGAHRIGTS